MPVVMSLSGTGRVLVGVGMACTEVDLATGRATPFGTLGANIVGGGGWDDVAFVIGADGSMLLRRGAAMETRNLAHAVRAVAVAREARRFAIVRSARGTDDVEVIDLADWQSHVIAVPSRDCFEIDAIALSPDGTQLGLTGFDIVYTSEGDWSYGQYERGAVYDLLQHAIIRELELGETSRPSEHERIPIALDTGAWYVGATLLPRHPQVFDDQIDAHPAYGERHLATVANHGLIVLTGDLVRVYRDAQLVAEHVLEQPGVAIAVTDDHIAVISGAGQLNLIAR